METSSASTGSVFDGDPVACEADEICVAGGFCRIKRYNLIDISTLLGGASGSANGINYAGQVVGEYFDNAEEQWRAFLYDGTVDDLGAGRAHAIAGDGAIIGTGNFNAQGRAFLMLPVGRDLDGDGVQDMFDNCPDVDNATQANSDNDSLGDACDNCTLVDNEDQRDTNSDGYGNFCDADLDDNGIVNFLDLELFKSVFFQSDSDADLDGNGVVNFADLEIVKRTFFGPPGPSGVAAAASSRN